MAAADVIAGSGPQLHARCLSNVFIKTNELPTAWIGFLNRKMRKPESRNEGSTHREKHEKPARTISKIGVIGIARETIGNTVTFLDFPHLFIYGEI